MINTPLPSLQQLRFLAAIEVHGHFGRAASACAVTQSTLSAGIQELEKRLGVTLIERGKRAMLTAIGAEVMARGKRLLRDAEELVEAAQSGHDGLAGPLRLGVIPTIGPYLVPAIMCGLAGEFPKLKLFLREEQTAPLLEKLEDGQLDLVLLALPYELGEAEAMELGSERLLAVVPRSHPLAAQRQITRDELAKAHLLLMEDGHCLRSHALEACQLTGANRNEMFQGTSLRTVMQMAAGGLGITLAPEMALAAELPADGSLVVRPLAEDAPPRRIALAWRRSAVRKAEFRRFGIYIMAVLAAGRPKAVTP